MKIIKVTYLHDYKIEMKYKNIHKKVTDFEEYLKASDHPLIKKYLDADLFAQFYNDDYRALCWGDNDFDINPQSILKYQFTVKSKEQ